MLQQHLTASCSYDVPSYSVTRCKKHHIGVAPLQRRRSRHPARNSCLIAALDADLHPDVDRILISEQEILLRVKELGSNLAEDYKDKESLMLGVLKGSFIFNADLVRFVRPWPEHMSLDFIRASSYGAGTSSSGSVDVSATEVLTKARGKHVLLVEDIVDSGHTVASIKQLLYDAGAKSVRVITLLDKHGRREADVTPDYFGFQVPNEFVVGYGLDFNEKYRSLPYIGVLKPECYS